MFNRNEITESFGPPNRIHYPWQQMEEYQPHGGMWITVPPESRAGWIEAAEQLMVDREAFYAACVRATEEWPRSTGVALTTPGMNQRAWLGHAACFILTVSPEESTRAAWHLLDDTEQFAANAAADEAIARWGSGQQDAQGSLF